MKRSANEKKKTAGQRLREIYKTGTGKSDTLEMRGREELLIRGCREILFYSTTEIVLRLRSYVLAIYGQELYCTAYFYDAVNVEGRIASLEMRERGARR